ncbi:fibronectin type 3 and ankyrin repeat domains protein 1 isoform X1 [Erpetoichthys calabaricus]|uniref:fibronectin type 3 and ankyrin repeat domains protein 1 isoform X1 n=1 Tax=Erpetoichthys calabaricus TaxID=27687 RepID=UPI0022348C43|nr:fibronectin type 3 and ankyrin repeat domains protein 1 isoform X1 [Erpetoichthys calabaricus]
MTTLEELELLKESPPVVGKVTHHSIELYWDEAGRIKRIGPCDQWLRFSVEEEDSRTHNFGTIHTGYSKHHIVEGLEPSTLYKFRLKITSQSGEMVYSPVVSVSTTREPMSGKHLHQAINVNDEEAVVQVLQSGTVNVDVPDKFGFTPLMVAAQKGYSSLMLACFAGHLDIVKFLRTSGADWETCDRTGSTAMHWAADGGHINVIRFLINDSCKVDSKDNGSLWTPLMRVSALSGNARVASLLIQAGADVNVQDKDGKTPLMMSALNNHEELVTLLLKNGANRHIKNEYGTSVLEMAKAFGRLNIAHLLEDKVI